MIRFLLPLAALAALGAASPVPPVDPMRPDKLPPLPKDAPPPAKPAEPAIPDLKAEVPPGNPPDPSKASEPERARAAVREWAEGSREGLVERFRKASTAFARAEAARRLGALSDRTVVSVLMEGLKDPEEIIREACGVSLAKIAGKDEIPILIQLLKHDVLEVREQANARLKVLVYVHFGSVHRKEEFDATAKRAADWWQANKEKLELPVVEPKVPDYDPKKDRETPREILDRAQIPIEVARLSDALEGGDPEVRGAAAVVLGELRDTSVFPKMVKNLKAAESTVRVQTANGLGRLGHPSAIPELIGGLEDENLRVRDACLEALETLARPFVNKNDTLGVQVGHYDRFREAPVQRWRAWWEANKDRNEIRYFDLFRPDMPLKKREDIGPLAPGPGPK